jgi:hypothetical protein
MSTEVFWCLIWQQIGQQAGVKIKAKRKPLLHFHTCNAHTILKMSHCLLIAV